MGGLFLPLAGFPSTNATGFFFFGALLVPFYFLEISVSPKSHYFPIFSPAFQATLSVRFCHLFPHL